MAGRFRKPGLKTYSRKRNIQGSAGCINDLLFNERAFTSLSVSSTSPEHTDNAGENNGKGETESRKQVPGKKKAPAKTRNPGVVKQAPKERQTKGKQKPVPQAAASPPASRFEYETMFGGSDSAGSGIAVSDVKVLPEQRVEPGDEAQKILKQDGNAGVTGTFSRKQMGANDKVRTWLAKYVPSPNEQTDIAGLDGSEGDNSLPEIEQMRQGPAFSGGVCHQRLFSDECFPHMHKMISTGRKVPEQSSHSSKVKDKIAAFMTELKNQGSSYNKMLSGPGGMTADVKQVSPLAEPDQEHLEVCHTDETSSKPSSASREADVTDEEDGVESGQADVHWISDGGTNDLSDYTETETSKQYGTSSLATEQYGMSSLATGSADMAATGQQVTTGQSNETKLRTTTREFSTSSQINPFLKTGATTEMGTSGQVTPLTKTEATVGKRDTSSLIAPFTKTITLAMKTGMRDIATLTKPGRTVGKSSFTGTTSYNISGIHQPMDTASLAVPTTVTKAAKQSRPCNQALVRAFSGKSGNFGTREQQNVDILRNGTANICNSAEQATSPERNTAGNKTSSKKTCFQNKRQRDGEITDHGVGIDGPASFEEESGFATRGTHPSFCPESAKKMKYMNSSTTNRGVPIGLIDFPEDFSPIKSSADEACLEQREKTPSQPTKLRMPSSPAKDVYKKSMKRGELEPKNSTQLFMTGGEEIMDMIPEMSTIRPDKAVLQSTKVRIGRGFRRVLHPGNNKIEDLMLRRMVIDEPGNQAASDCMERDLGCKKTSTPNKQHEGQIKLQIDDISPVVMDSDGSSSGLPQRQSTREINSEEIVMSNTYIEENQEPDQYIQLESEEIGVPHTNTASVVDKDQGYAKGQTGLELKSVIGDGKKQTAVNDSYSTARGKDVQKLIKKYRKMVTNVKLPDNTSSKLTSQGTKSENVNIGPEKDKDTSLVSMEMTAVQRQQTDDGNVVEKLHKDVEDPVNATSGEKDHALIIDARVPSAYENHVSKLSSVSCSEGRLGGFLSHAFRWSDRVRIASVLGLQPVRTGNYGNQSMFNYSSQRHTTVVAAQSCRTKRKIAWPANVPVCTLMNEEFTCPRREVVLLRRTDKRDTCLSDISNIPVDDIV